MTNIIQVQPGSALIRVLVEHTDEATETEIENAALAKVRIARDSLHGISTQYLEGEGVTIVTLWTD